MKFTDEEYFRAGIERMRQAREIHDSSGNFALAMYTSGLAVECILRAFRWSKDKSFEGRHDLEDLLKASDLLRINERRSQKRGISEDERRQSSIALRAAMNEVVVLLHNNLRFAPESSLRAFLNRIGRLQGVKGDALKKNSTDLLNAAQMVVDRGVTLWTLRKK
jgi:HEPN domain-containing protein